MVDANHAYNLNDALYVGRGLDELDILLVRGACST